MMKLFDYIFHSAVFIISNLVTPGCNLMIKMLTVDSLYSALHFLRSFVDKEITDSQIINDTIYTRSTIDRYIYYFIIFSIYKIVSLFFWTRELPYYPAILLILPPFLNRLIEMRVFALIIRMKEKLIKILIAKQLVLLIKFVGRVYLDKEINVKYKELLPLFNDYKKTIEYLTQFIKTIVIVSIVLHVKKSKIYYRVANLFYQYQTGDMLESFSGETAKGALINVINRKKWDELLKPNTFKAVLHLYQNNMKTSNFLDELLIKMEYKMVKIFTVWTLSSLFNCIYIAPIISLFLYFYRDGKSVLVGSLTIHLIGTIIGLTTNSFLLTSLICQSGHYLIVNSVTGSACKFVEKKLKKRSMKIYDQHSNKLILIGQNAIYALLFSHTINYWTILMTSIYIFNVKNYPLLILLLTGFISDYNPAHLVLNSILIFVLLLVHDSVGKTAYDDLFSIYFSLKVLLGRRRRFSTDSCAITKNRSREPEKPIDELDDNIFELSNDKFIDAISIDDSISPFSITKNGDNLNIIHNYVD